MPVQGRETGADEKFMLPCCRLADDHAVPANRIARAVRSRFQYRKFSKKRGAGLHHVAFKVDDLPATVNATKRTPSADCLNEARQSEPAATSNTYSFTRDQRAASCWN